MGFGGGNVDVADALSLVYGKVSGGNKRAGALRRSVFVALNCAHAKKT